MINKKSNTAKSDAKIVVDKNLDKLKNVHFTSGKPEKIRQADFKLSL